MLGDLPEQKRSRRAGHDTEGSERSQSEGGESSSDLFVANDALRAVRPAKKKKKGARKSEPIPEVRRRREKSDEYAEDEGRMESQYVFIGLIDQQYLHTIWIGSWGWTSNWNWQLTSE